MNEKISNPTPPMADIETASDDYATRFAGSAGQWLLWIQEKGTRNLLNQVQNIHRVLEVGGGHAQLTHVFAENNRELLVAGSAPEAGARLERHLNSDRCQYQSANLLRLPYANETFDLVASFRLLTHCEEWETLVEELCRSSRKAIIVDYPTSQSVNAIAPALFNAKKKVEKNTRYWRSFRHEEVDAAFSKHGFQRMATYKQFFFPMALHRMLRCRQLSQIMEGVARTCGLTRWLGSPVIALYLHETEDS